MNVDYVHSQELRFGGKRNTLPHIFFNLMEEEVGRGRKRFNREDERERQDYIPSNSLQFDGGRGGEGRRGLDSLTTSLVQ